MNIRYTRIALAVASAGLAVTAHAQTAGKPPAGAAPTQLPPVVVTGNPLGSDLFDLAPPVSVLHGQDLFLLRRSTLGETLNELPGVSSSYFGPNASRPVIRGLDTDRIRILQNGVGMLDASSLSPDHAVAVDPLVIERAEVVRGPAALLYGGTAVGGVVNVIDNRIPQAPIDGPGGRVEARFGGAEREKAAAGVFELGHGNFALHADLYQRRHRRSQDQRPERLDASAGSGPDARGDARHAAQQRLALGRRSARRLLHLAERLRRPLVCRLRLEVRDRGRTRGHDRHAKQPIRLRGRGARAGQHHHRREIQARQHRLQAHRARCRGSRDRVQEPGLRHPARVDARQHRSAEGRVRRAGHQLRLFRPGRRGVRAFDQYRRERIFHLRGIADRTSQALFRRSPRAQRGALRRRRPGGPRDRVTALRSPADADV